jgi:hypothetical protein
MAASGAAYCHMMLKGFHNVVVPLGEPPAERTIPPNIVLFSP